MIEGFFVSNVVDGGTAASPASSEEIATNGTQEFSDYVLLGRNSKPIAVIEAKRSSKNAELGREQAKQYCQNIQATNRGSSADSIK